MGRKNKAPKRSVKDSSRLIAESQDDLSSQNREPSVPCADNATTEVPNHSEPESVVKTGIFVAVIIFLVMFRIGFAATFPLETGGDGDAYHKMIRNGTSSLVHMAGYPFLFHHIQHWFPTNRSLLLCQHGISLVCFLVVMILIRRRFGLLTSVVFGCLYGLDVGILSGVSVTRPEWFQGDLFLLTLVLAFEAYSAGTLRRKVTFYLLSGLTFTWSLLVKLLTIILIPIYFNLFLFDHAERKIKFCCVAGIALIAFVNLMIFVHVFHFPSTGTTQLTHDKGWIFFKKIKMVLPREKINGDVGINMKRYLLLNSYFPKEMFEAENIPIYRTFSHIDGIDKSKREQGQALFDDISRLSESEMDARLAERQLDDDFIGNYLTTYVYLGLPETDALIGKIFREMIVRYPGHYAMNVAQGFMRSLFYSPSVPRLPILRGLHEAKSGLQTIWFDPDDILSNFDWGYVSFKNSPECSLFYSEPRVWKPGLVFFSYWSKIRIPTWLRWLLILSGFGIAAIRFRKNRHLDPALFYLTLAVLSILSFMLLSNLVFVFRWKEYQVINPLWHSAVAVAIHCILFADRKEVPGKWASDANRISCAS